MPPRYTNLPYTALESTALPVAEAEGRPDITSKDEGAASVPKQSLITWAKAIQAMIVHCILSVALAVFVLVYVDRHHFNLTERYPSINVVDGTQKAPFLPMQSDIVTFLSSILAISKCALTAWAGLLCWNVALFLMEKRGLVRRDLQTLLKYGLLAPRAYSKDWSAWVIGALLVASLAAGLASPVLTGSISWAPSNRLVHGVSGGRYILEDTLDGTITQLPEQYTRLITRRYAEALRSVGLVSFSWGRKSEKGIFKRATNWSTQLEANSTINNATLPYFKVHSIRWVESSNEDNRIGKGVDLFRPQYLASPSPIPPLSNAAVILFPNVTTNWTSDPLESVIIHDTRLMLFTCGTTSPTGAKMFVTQDLPPNAYIENDGVDCYAFAWVTFSAGVGRCKNHRCIVSNPFTIQSGGPIEPEPHQLTFQALVTAPIVSAHLTQHNQSVPYLWDNLNDYVEAVLVRAYSGAWSTLNWMSPTANTESDYVPALASLVANVDRMRVYIWLGIQLLVTSLSILFLIMRSRLSRRAFINDTSLLAFELDTTAVPRDTIDSSISSVKVRQQGDRLVV
ncbi:unnamed protein product [Rhizoctonia solani]|uniref:Transmembrane protein n=1 Tax=Rhizoctonia solani TaxID=456999 RepID=A0A8H3DW92_9AGAM|nr:unnamed protein product [Rhizoctonia solani]